MPCALVRVPCATAKVALNRQPLASYCHCSGRTSELMMCVATFLTTACALEEEKERHAKCNCRPPAGLPSRGLCSEPYIQLANYGLRLQYQRMTRVQALQEHAGIKGPGIGLVLTAAQLSVKLPNTQAWCLTAPDVLAAAGLAAGAQTLVGVTNQGTAASSSKLGTPGKLTNSPASTSLFAPVAMPDLQSPGVELLPLSKQHSQYLGHAGVSKHENSSSSSGGGGSPTAGRLGEWMVPAQIWPSSKLPRGLICISSVVAEMLGQPSANTVLAVLPLQPAASGQAAYACEACAVLALQLCYDSQRCQVARVSAAPMLAPQQQLGAAGHGVSSSPSTPAAPSRHMPRTASDKDRKGAAAAASPAAKTASMSQQPAMAPMQALEEWVLQLFGPSTQHNAASGQAAQEGPTSEQRLLLSHVLAGRLAGRPLLLNNLVPVPLLGQTLLCQVVHMAATNGLQIHHGSCGPTTKVVLLMPDEKLEVPTQDLSAPAQSSPDKMHVQHDAVTDIALSSMGELTAGQVRHPRSLPHLVAAARQAAEEELGEGGAHEAAAAVAERAVTSGWSAAGMDYSSLGGVSHLVSHLRELVTLPLRAPELFKSFQVRPPRGVLLHGPPGSGKTVLAQAAAGDAGAVLLVVNGPDVMSEFLGESEAGLRGVFAAARALRPSIIFIDEIDAIAPARGGGAAENSGPASVLGGGSGGSDTASRLVTALLTCMDGPGGAGPGDGVIVVGATNRPAALDAALRRPGRLERELEVGPPPPESRLQILAARLRTVRHNLTADQLQALADAAHGFVAADLTALVNEAALSALRRSVSGQIEQQQQQQLGTIAQHQGAGLQQAPQDHDRKQHVQNQAASAAGLPSDVVAVQDQQQQQALLVQWHDFEAARARVKPSALRELAVEVPHTSWDDVGGLHGVKQKLKEAVIWPFKSPQALARLGAVAPRGVLLYGPPGCSKTLLAKAVAAEAKLNFLSIKGGELFSKYVGQTEKAVAALFARARATAPTIVFFDEIDSLAAARTSESGGLSDRVMAQLLSEMDGLQQHVGVVVLAATNRPDRVDPALLRPGRFDRLVYVPPPDSQTRLEILQVHLRRTPVADDVDLAQLASACTGFSGADMGALVREAALAALEESLQASEVCMRHFQAAKELIIPSAIPSAHMEKLYKDFSSSGAAMGPVF